MAMRRILVVLLLAACRGVAFEPAALGAVRFTPPPTLPRDVDPGGAEQGPIGRASDS
jgi:hypothetical protein